MVEDQGKFLPPEDDWLPVLFLIKDQNTALVGLPPANTESEKILTAVIIRTTIRKTNPDAVCYLSTAWKGSMDANRFMDQESFDEAYSKGWIPRPSQDPDKEEIVILVMMNRQKETGCIMGFVERRKNLHPLIKRWEELGGKNTGIGGRFGDAIEQGFASADINGNLEVLNTFKGLQRVEAQEEENGRTKTE